MRDAGYCVYIRREGCGGYHYRNGAAEAFADLLRENRGNISDSCATGHGNNREAVVVPVMDMCGVYLLRKMVKNGHSSHRSDRFWLTEA